MSNAQRFRLKRVTFTLSNYDENDELRIRSLADYCEYLIYGREIAPTTGTRHLQGFCNFKTKREFRTIKRLIGDAAHIEPAHGDDVSNQVYCSKDGDFYEFGQPSFQGKRNDLSEVAKAIKEGSKLYDLVENYTEMFIRYPRGIERTVEILGAGRPGGRRNWKTELIVYVGKSGSGKSRLAADLCATEPTYYKPMGKWWNNYAGEKNVIIDDFYGWIAYDEFLRVTDRYPHQVEVKGGFVEFLATKIYVTSNKKIEDWWRGEWYDDERREPLIRRLTVYEYFDIDNGRAVRTDIMPLSEITEFIVFE
ncbi:replication-associated protein [robinz virus RP_584]|uniref:Replication-associated protein n=1 Tax=robinz virus RP_584 TaxID=2886400 RepID=A0A8K1PFT5_9CIRC|nr:replication-associated protein [robinz virus RP_584]UDN67412.1 replication-associated protein [robinz virus RP_584]